MAEYLIQSKTLDDIADAINAKTGGSSSMTPAEMVEAIGSISSGGGGLVIDEGTFTLASNAASYSVPHSLDTVPTIVLIYPERISDVPVGKQAGGITFYGDSLFAGTTLTYTGTKVPPQKNGYFSANNGEPVGRDSSWYVSADAQNVTFAGGGTQTIPSGVKFIWKAILVNI